MFPLSLLHLLQQVRDGFGIGYIIKDEGIQFCAASKRRQTDRLLLTLSMYLREAATMLEDAADAASAAAGAGGKLAKGVGKLLMKKKSTGGMDGGGGAAAAGGAAAQPVVARQQSGGGYDFWGIDEDA